MTKNENGKYERIVAIIIICFFSLVTIISIGLFIYNMFILDLGFSKSYRPLLFLVALGVSILRPKRNQKKNLDFYNDLYMRDIGDAFLTRPGEKKMLLKALREFYNNNFEKSAKMLDNLFKKCKTDEEKLVVLLFTAKNYNARNMTNSAYATYNKMLDIDPRNKTANNNIGVMYMNDNNFDKALMHFENAIRFSNDYVFGYYNISQLRLRTGRFDDAIDYANKAINIDNSFAPAIETLAIAYGAKWDEENMDIYIQKAMSMGIDTDAIEWNIDYYRDLYFNSSGDIEQ